MVPDLDAARRLPPQLGQAATTRAMMIDVLVALLPALGMAVFFFGARVLVLAAVSVASCVFFEYGYRRLTHQSQTIGDLSAHINQISFMCKPVNHCRHKHNISDYG